MKQNAFTRYDEKFVCSAVDYAGFIWAGAFQSYRLINVHSGGPGERACRDYYRPAVTGTIDCVLESAWAQALESLKEKVSASASNDPASQPPELSP